MSDKFDVEAALARCEAATPGPWAAWVDDKLNWSIGQADREYCGLVGFGYGDLAAADADFVVHARTDLPDALAEIRRLREAFQALLHTYDNWRISPAWYDARSALEKE